MRELTDSQLKEEHTSAAIADRIARNHSHGDLGDFVLGAVDGTVTTFAIVSGVIGADVQKGMAVAFVLGLANVLADGFSMGVSNYLKARSDVERLSRLRELEETHIDRIPEGEKEEIRQIFAAKGFANHLLEDVVEIITKDRRLWVDTMLTEEWGIQPAAASPLRSALITFAAFIGAGIIPLLPLLFGIVSGISPLRIYQVSVVLTLAVFFLTGLLRGKVLGQSAFRGGVETMLMGAAAASMAYMVGRGLHDWIGK